MNNNRDDEIHCEQNRTTIFYDKTEFHSEPTVQEAAEISNRILSSRYDLHFDSDGLSKFVYVVGRHGHAFCPVFFVYNPEKGFAVSEQRLFVLEFAGGITFREVINRAQQYDLPVLFAYRRFLSTKKKECFCIAYLLDKPVTSKLHAWSIRVLLRTVFPESDPGDADLAKIYLGGNYSIFCNDAVPMISCEALYDASCKHTNRNRPERMGINYYRLSSTTNGNLANEIHG